MDIRLKAIEQVVPEIQARLESVEVKLKDMSEANAVLGELVTSIEARIVDLEAKIVAHKSVPFHDDEKNGKGKSKH